MRIIFVRHGDPDYTHDCLTDTGRQQAAIVARRLADEGIERVFSSSCGRARQTAEQIAAPLCLPVELCDFMREIRWGSRTDAPIPHDGHPWRIVDDMIASGQSLLQLDWANTPPFCDSWIPDSVETVCKGLDQWLAELGYDREETVYRVRSPQYGTVMMAGHGGSFTAALAHLFSLPFPFVCHAIRPYYTAITIVSLSSEPGAFTAPRFDLVNDARHLLAQGAPTFSTT